ncbi:hypothetical protein K466DRAFT_583759 [Polyporus arcularius HHB13444]|uniref:Integral membrane protein n=1 Tax=Polyporus arcularius HHB13444 TaxID=1314778 RepID=A0A5C3PWG7_9APHY|nr:hypothetical protein K466DRAFT_583759 [Polyporus arcularius HHB13444]
MPSSLYVPVLIAGMLVTGSSNSLWSKWQDMQCVENCDDPNPAHRVLYEQPVWQTLQMFLGEMLCFLPVIYSLVRARRQTQPLRLPSDSEEEPAAGAKPEIPQARLRGWKLLLLWFPAACDLTGTTLMNVGLLYTPVSIYQMTRGALVLFVGVLSVIFLRRRLWLYQWVSLITVMAGVSLVGLSGSMVKDAVKESGVNTFDEIPPPEPIEEPEVTKVLVGVFFILFAQVFTATQFVVEEKIMSRYSVAPLVAVGFEGLFGALSIVLAMPLLARYASVSPFFDLPRGWHQMVDTPSVLYSGLVIALSISLFNFFGLSVTRHVSATARSLTDTCRTLSIWIVSLGLGWEVLVWPISLLQVSGFVLLVYGTFLFNHLVTPPRFLRPASERAAAAPTDDEGETQTLLAEESLDDTAVLPVDLGRGGFDVVPPEEHATHPHGRVRTTSQGASEVAV